MSSIAPFGIASNPPHDPRELAAVAHAVGLLSIIEGDWRHALRAAEVEALIVDSLEPDPTPERPRRAGVSP